MLERFRFPCLHCSMSFRFSSHLKRHIRTHNGEAPYCCKHCLQCFKRKQHLAAHTSRVHSSPSLRLRCSDCDHSFTDRANLLRHALVMHRGLRRWVCGVCSGNYCHSADLRRHLLVRHSLHLPVLTYMHKRTRDQVYIFPEIGTYDITADVKMKIECHCKEELAKYQNVVDTGIFDKLYPKKRSKKSSCVVEINHLTVGTNTNVDNPKGAEGNQDVRNDSFPDYVTSMKLMRNNAGCSTYHQRPTEVSDTDQQSVSVENPEPKQEQQVGEIFDLPDLLASWDSNVSDQQKLVIIEGSNQKLVLKIGEQCVMSASVKQEHSEAETSNKEQLQAASESSGVFQLVPQASNHHTQVTIAAERPNFDDEAEPSTASFALRCEPNNVGDHFPVLGEPEHSDTSANIQPEQYNLAQSPRLEEKCPELRNPSYMLAELLTRSIGQSESLVDRSQQTASVSVEDCRGVSLVSCPPLLALKNDTAQLPLHCQQMDDCILTLNQTDPAAPLFGDLTTRLQNNPIVSHTPSNNNTNSLPVPVFLNQFLDSTKLPLTSLCSNDLERSSTIQSDNGTVLKSVGLTSRLSGTTFPDSHEHTPFQSETAPIFLIQSPTASNVLMPPSAIEPSNHDQVALRHYNFNPIMSRLANPKQIACEHSETDQTLPYNTFPSLMMPEQTHPPHLLAHQYQIVSAATNQWHILSGVQPACPVVPGHTISMVPVLLYQCSLCGLTFLSHQLCTEHVMTTHTVFGAAPPAPLAEHLGEDTRKHSSVEIMNRCTILEASASYTPDQIPTPNTEPVWKKSSVNSSQGHFLVQYSQTQTEFLDGQSCKLNQSFNVPSCHSSLNSSHCAINLPLGIYTDHIIKSPLAAPNTDAVEANSNHYSDDAIRDTRHSSNINQTESLLPCSFSTPQKHLNSDSDPPASVMNSNICAKRDIFSQTEQFTNVESSKYWCGATGVTPVNEVSITSARVRSEHVLGQKMKDCSTMARNEHQNPTILHHGTAKRFETSRKNCPNLSIKQSRKKLSSTPCEEGELQPRCQVKGKGDNERSVITVTVRTCPLATTDRQVDRIVLSVGQGASEAALQPWRQRAASTGHQLVLLSPPSSGGDAQLSSGPEADNSAAVRLVRLECGACGHQCCSAKQLTRHKRCHDAAQHRCETCSRSFREKHNLAAHEQTHAAARPSHPCPHCRSTYRHAKDLAEHVSRHHHAPGAALPEPFECEVCGQVFARLPNLSRHWKEQHASVLHECPVCGRGFKRQRYLQLKHMLLHTKAPTPGTRGARKKPG